jgi:hypothetical protein
MKSHPIKAPLGLFILAVLLAAAGLSVAGQGNRKAGWRAATPDELRDVIPARAPVEKERIETEFPTASGITDSKGKYVAGVVLITAGYSADGKYSHYFVTQVPLKVADFVLPPADYVFGFRHDGDALTVKFYEAQTGKFVGSVQAVRQSRIGRIESFHVYPPGEHSLIAIGRFGFGYEPRE